MTASAEALRPTPTYVHASDADGLTTYELAILAPALATPAGLPREAILGRLTAGPQHIDAAHIEPNPLFAQFLGWVIANTAHESPALVAEAQRQSSGFVYIADEREPHRRTISPENLVGAVEVKGGKMLHYLGNPNYRVFTAAGAPRLDPWLQARWMAALAARCVRPVPWR